jgi:hypothetical protein
MKIEQIRILCRDVLMRRRGSDLSIDLCVILNYLESVKKINHWLDNYRAVRLACFFFQPINPYNLILTSRKTRVHISHDEIHLLIYDTFNFPIASYTMNVKHDQKLSWEIYHIVLLKRMRSSREISFVSSSLIYFFPI